jgi:hypothetical protein
MKMKKRFSYLLFVAMTGLFVSGCASAIPHGVLYTEVGFPGGVGAGDISYTKVGKSMSKSYFMLVATGDASIEAAVKDGGIQKIKYVDYKTKNLLGIIGEYTTYVYGD